MPGGDYRPLYQLTSIAISFSFAFSDFGMTRRTVALEDIANTPKILNIIKIEKLLKYNLWH